LFLVVPSTREAERIADQAVGRRRPLGTWARYRQEIESARAIHGALSWSLSEDEERLMKALEDYAPASQANAA
jgi:hypothetical protein